MLNTRNSNRETQNVQKTNADTYDLDICTSDPGWAEHARPNDMGPEPCDDGRGIQFKEA
nr:hypothetical protein [uncultured Desulfobacter sp.]